MSKGILSEVKLDHGTPPVCRLGLATRGNTNLSPHDVRFAIDRGVNYLNWCRHRDAMSETISELTSQEREKLVVAFQFYARRALEAEKELSRVLKILKTDYVDIATFYYVESVEEWNEISGAGGALDYLERAKEEGKVRMIGLTTHQRALAARWIKSGHLDLLMVRYNAAHRGAEEQVFPICRKLGIPVIVFTCLRWGTLLETTPEDPSDFHLPDAPSWYRFALSQPDVSVALTAPNDHRELVENLSILENWNEFDSESWERLQEHGRRVYKHGGSFP